MDYRCPGNEPLHGDIKILEKVCPECGQELEILSTEDFVECECGSKVYNELRQKPRGKKAEQSA